MSFPFFSIITPVYNSEEYISDCIESVIKQTYDNWELILIDDGSSDNSGIICDNFAKIDSRIKILHKVNDGAYKARLSGISIASGEYYVGLDSDDMLEADCLEAIHSNIQKYKCDVISYQYKYIENDFVSEPLLAPDKEYTRDEFILSVLEKRRPAPWDKAIKMKYVKEANYSEAPDNISISLDTLSIIPALCEIETVWVMNQGLYRYRVRPDSICHSISLKKMLDLSRIYEFDENVLKKKGIYSSDLEKVLYVDYLKNILSSVISSYKKGDIKRIDLKEIKKAAFYKKSEKYELIKYFSLNDFRKLKALRRSITWLM